MDATHPDNDLRGRAVAGPAKEPSLPTVTFIFWASFTVALVAARIMDPELFSVSDPDSFLRLVEVRDFLNGQGFYDMVQHRMDPPGGALLQWSRLIDLPLAALVLVGRAIGLGENLALTGWPLLLFLGLLGGLAGIAKRLGGRLPAIFAVVLALGFLDPMIVYLPGDIDHHNAQIALMVFTVAMTLRLPSGPLYGVLAGLGSAVTLAIGLEMLPHVVILAAIIAIRYAWTGAHGRAVAAFGATLGVLPALLYWATGTPAAPMACDALSWSFAIPALIGGGGVAAIALLGEGRGRGVRIAGVLLAGAAGAAWFAGVTPECLGGPYGQLSPEVKSAFLATVSEAQPIWVYAAREPVGAAGSLGSLIVAIWVAIRHMRRDPRLWAVPTALMIMATLLSLYQVRTLPFASALAIPVLAVWIAELRAAAAGADTRLGRTWPIALGFVLAVPYTWLLVGYAGEKAVAAITDGRVVPVAQPQPDAALVEGLTTAQKNCFDPASAALFAEVPRGLVVAPLFYGSTVLRISGHDVVAGPYHRNGKAILDAIDTMRDAPNAAKAIIDRRGIAYVAICATSQESAITRAQAPDGLLAGLLAGRTPGWLTPVAAKEPTMLKLWRVVRPTT